MTQSLSQMYHIKIRVFRVKLVKRKMEKGKARGPPGILIEAWNIWSVMAYSRY